MVGVYFSFASGMFGYIFWLPSVVEGANQLAVFLPTRAARVEVTLKDGTQLSKGVDAVRGTAKNPMSHEEVVGKASDLMSSVLGASKSGELIQKVFGLTQVKGIKDLRPLLQP